MKVCVLGAGGLLGHMLIRTLSESNDVYGTTRGSADQSSTLAKFLPLDKWIGSVDVSNMRSVEALFEKKPFDVAINCIGLIKQRDGRVSDDQMMQINAEFPHQLANIVNRAGAKLIHLGTDCVFSGSRGNYFETDEPNPTDIYGKSKLMGEINDNQNLTLRTSHIGRELSVKKSFVEWLISQKNRKINGFSHAIYSGLTTKELSQVIAKLLLCNSELVGLFHVSSTPISKLEIINKLNLLLELKLSVNPDSSVQIDRSLNSDKFQKLTGIIPQSWDAMLSDFCKDQKFYD